MEDFRQSDTRNQRYLVANVSFKNSSNKLLLHLHIKLVPFTHKGQNVEMGQGSQRHGIQIRREIETDVWLNTGSKKTIVTK